MKDKIAKCVSSIQLSLIREMGLRAAAYDNVISLGIGEPDFDTPAEICQAALADALAGYTHYTPSQGDTELLEELSGFLNHSRGLEVPPSQIVITQGGMGGLSSSLRTLLEGDDELLLPEPHFPAHRANSAYVGGKIVYLPTSFEDGFVLRPETVEQALTPRSKVLLINSPNNPTGCVIPGQVLDELARLAVERDLVVISDEVYDRLVFKGRHESIYTRPGMDQRTVVINSFSKTFAMTGWRLGYAYGPAWLMKEMVKVVTNTTSCASSVSQRAALAALRADQNRFDDMAAEFKARCELAYERLKAMPGLQVNPPLGSFYIFPSIAELTADSQSFALDLLDQEQVVTVPGSAFGPSGEGCLRLACTVDQERLTEALDRIERFVRRYPARRA